MKKDQKRLTMVLFDGQIPVFVTAKSLLMRWKEKATITDGDVVREASLALIKDLEDKMRRELEANQ